MKRWMLFGYDEHYPGGGWIDFLHSYDTFEKAVAAINNNAFGRYDHYQVVDKEDGGATFF